MPKFDGDFAKYIEFADSLERDLVTLHGKAKAKRLFARMNPEEFQEFCKAASCDPLKQRWLRMILTGYAQALGEGKEAA